MFFLESWGFSFAAIPQALSHFFHSFKPVSEIFTFASTRNVDGNMISEVIIPPEGLVQAHSIGNTPFEVPWYCLHKELELGPLGELHFLFFSLSRVIAAAFQSALHSQEQIILSALR